jgi:hypothetical protein
MHIADLRCDRLHRGPQRGIFVAVLPHHAHRALEDLSGKLGGFAYTHSLKSRNLHRNRGDSLSLALGALSNGSSRQRQEGAVMAKQAAEAVSRPSCKAELEEVIEEFERASEALPPDEHALHSWMQRARDLRSRALASNELGRNKLLLKIRAFRMRIWAMRADRRQYRTQRAELGFSSPSESIWEQAPTQLTHQRRHKLSLAIASSWQQGSAQQPPISWIRPKILQPTSKQEEDSAATALANTSSQPKSINNVRRWSITGF